VPQSIALDRSKLKWSDISKPSPSLHSEVYELSITNIGSDRVTEFTIGFRRSIERSDCSARFEDYDRLKRFPVNLLPGDSVTLKGAFNAQANGFCIVKAMGPPEGRSACANLSVPPEAAIAACTRSIQSGQVRENELAADYINRAVR
jgi:hypothetical protein